MNGQEFTCPHCERPLEIRISVRSAGPEKGNRPENKRASLLQRTAALGLVAAIAAGCSLITVLLHQHFAANKIRAGRFILVDSSGKSRATIEMTAGGPRLVMCDEAGRPLVGMGIDKEGPKLDLSDESGKLRAMIRLNKDGPMLAMADETGRPRLGMGVATNGPGMALADEAGKPRAGIGVDNGIPRLAISDEAGKPRLAMGVDKDGPKLDLSDESGTSRSAITLTSNGPMLAMADETGRPRLGMGVDQDGPRVSISDRSGKSRAMMRMDNDGPKMGVADETGKPRVTMAVNKNDSTLDLNDETDKYRAAIRLNKNSAGLELSDELKKTNLKNLLAAIPSPDAGKNLPNPIDYLSVRRPSLECPGITTNAPTIDGRLDENCWKKAGVAAAFMDKDAGAEAAHQTRAYVLHDNKNIYIGITCAEPFPKLMLAAITNRDGNVWNENEIEVFFDVKRQGNRIRQLCLNSLGTQNDQKIDNGSKDLKWNSSWTAKTSVQSDGWTAEMSIPMKDLDANPPLQNDIWGINICRVRRLKTDPKDRKTDNKPEYSCFSPTFGAFLRPERFGDLIFK